MKNALWQIIMQVLRIFYPGMMTALASSRSLANATSMELLKSGFTVTKSGWRRSTPPIDAGVSDFLLVVANAALFSVLLARCWTARMQALLNAWDWSLSGSRVNLYVILWNKAQSIAIFAHVYLEVAKKWSSYIFAYSARENVNAHRSHWSSTLRPYNA